ncbi:MAG: response regulator [Myxococcota bacterium]|nr:response regulator [Myxococcota bacterium]
MTSTSVGLNELVEAQSAILDCTPVVLVVDDEPDVRSLVMQRFRKKIRKKELKFLFAANGAEALDILANNRDVDMIVSDINMPVMDGLTLLSELKAQYPTIKAVIVSAYGDMKNIREAMNKGAFDFLTKPLDFQDFESTLDKTLEHVRALQLNLLSLRENNIMRMFVDEGALAFMLRRFDQDQITKTETINASTVFIDVCGFTALSAREDSTKILKLLNSYFDEIVDKILNNRGAIDKFLGDAVMATFRGDGHEHCAALACLQVRDAIQSMHGVIEEEFGFSPDVSIGLNSGQVVYGPIGAKRVNRLDFTVIGDSVNVAARLQALAGPGDILVTGEMADSIRDEFELQSFGVHPLKGKPEPIEVFRLVDIAD